MLRVLKQHFRINSTLYVSTSDVHQRYCTIGIPLKRTKPSSTVTSFELLTRAPSLSASDSPAASHRHTMERHWQKVSKLLRTPSSA